MGRGDCLAHKRSRMPIDRVFLLSVVVLDRIVQPAKQVKRESRLTKRTVTTIALGGVNSLARQETP
jgi:hypothetical protein